MARSDDDSLRRYLDLLVAALDEPVDSPELARRAFLSRYSFDHLVSAGAGEPPATLRRRLLLERAAHDLTRTDRSVTDIALDADYENPGSFTRAFASVLGASPTDYRKRGTSAFWLEAPNGVHFHPPGGLLIADPARKEHGMDLVDRLIDHDLWLTGNLIDAAAGLPDADLDRALDLGDTEVPLVGEPTLRRLLGRLVFTKEMWTAAIVGRAFHEDLDQTVPGLRRRLDAISGEFRELVREIRAGGRWNDAFIDTTCEPPETFTFGGAIAHVITFSAYRREIALGALRRAGLADLGIGDPIEWERSSAAG